MRHTLAVVSLFALSNGCAPNAPAMPGERDASATDAPATEVFAGSDRPVVVTDAGSVEVGSVMADVPTSTDAGFVVDVPPTLDAGAVVDGPAAVDVPVAVDRPVAAVDSPTADAGEPEGPPLALVDALVGTWATRLRGAITQSAPIIGAVRTTNTAYGVAVFARGPAGTIVVTERACRVVFDRSTLGQTSIEDRAVQSVSPATAAVRFVRVGAAWRWQRAARTVAVGWRPMTSPEEMLPTVRTDPRVFDADGDGNPGVSVRIQSFVINGSVYVVQAQRGALDGDWGTGNVPRAVSDPTGSTQRTVGASSRALEQDLPAAVDASPAANGVTFARMPAGTECVGLIAAISSLFP